MATKKKSTKATAKGEDLASGFGLGDVAFLPILLTALDELHAHNARDERRTRALEAASEAFVELCKKATPVFGEVKVDAAPRIDAATAIAASALKAAGL